MKSKGIAGGTPDEFLEERNSGGIPERTPGRFLGETFENFPKELKRISRSPEEFQIEILMISEKSRVILF